MKEVRETKWVEQTTVKWFSDDGTKLLMMQIKPCSFLGCKFYNQPIALGCHHTFGNHYITSDGTHRKTFDLLLAHTINVHLDTGTWPL